MNIPKRRQRSLGKMLRYAISIPERCLSFVIRPGGLTYTQLYEESA